MSQLLPSATTVGDICGAALQEAGWIGVGQTPLAEDIQGAWARLQWMLQEWQNKRWLVYHLVTYVTPSTGAQFYTLGPGGNIDTGTGSQRPDKIESAFLRQLTQSQPNQIDYPLDLLQSMEDYNKIALKELTAFPTSVFLDAAFPLGKLYVWPVPQPAIYAIGVAVKETLPASFPTLATILSLPFDYYNCILYNLALRLRAWKQIGSFPGDMLPGLAKDALNVLRNSAVGISRLTVPSELSRPGIYNIFNDRVY